jgi:hypothetical protein
LTIIDQVPNLEGQEISLSWLADKHWHLEYSDHLPILFDLRMRTAKSENDDA